MSDSKWFKAEITIEKGSEVAHIKTINVDHTNTFGSVTVEDLCRVLSPSSDDFETPVLPPNVLQMLKKGNATVVTVYSPSHTRNVRYHSYNNKSLFPVTLPNSVFFITFRNGKYNGCRIHTLDDSGWSPNADYFDMPISNYAGYICWGRNMSLIDSFSNDDGTPNLQNCANIPELFYSSVFNADLGFYGNPQVDTYKGPYLEYVEKAFDFYRDDDDERQADLNEDYLPSSDKLSKIHNYFMSLGEDNARALALLIYSDRLTYGFYVWINRYIFPEEFFSPSFIYRGSPSKYDAILSVLYR